MMATQLLDDDDDAFMVLSPVRPEKVERPALVLFFFSRPASRHFR
jgi:hypothetical protein